MASISDILDVLEAYGIRLGEGDPDDIDLPGIGEIEEGETVYSTSVREVFGGYRPSDEDAEFPDEDNSRLREWRNGVERIIEEMQANPEAVTPKDHATKEPPEPHCAWYCPIHYFGHGWGIYIRERWILSYARSVAAFVDWSLVGLPRGAILRHLLRSAFYALFLHQQFHHRVELMGLQFLVSTESDRYRPYMRNVYRPAYRRPYCLEEGLAAAESYRGLGGSLYSRFIDPAIRAGAQEFLEASMRMQPHGYREGICFLSHFPYEATYRDGVHELQSCILEGALTPKMPPGHWLAAPGAITSMRSIADDIYVIMPVGAQPVFSPTNIRPGFAASSKGLEKALTEHYGYRSVPGEKAPYVKLEKSGARTITLPGDRPVLAPGVVKHVLEEIAGYPNSRLPDLLDGKL